MLPDPMTINYFGDKVFARQGTSNPEVLGRFLYAPDNIELTVRQNKTAARFRREMRFTVPKIVEDPISGVSKEVSASCILAFDEPRFGFSDADLLNLWSGLLGFTNPSDGEKLKRVIAGEN